MSAPTSPHGRPVNPAASRARPTFALLVGDDLPEPDDLPDPDDPRLTAGEPGERTAHDDPELDVGVADELDELDEAPPLPPDLVPASTRLGRTSRSAPNDPRSRIMRAVVDAAVSGRLDRTSVVELCRHAGIAERRAFYAWFAGRQDAFLAACLEADAALRSRVEHAYARTPGMSARARAQACVDAIVRFVTDDPRRAEALVVHGHAAGPDLAIARERTMRWLAALVQHATRRLPAPSAGRELVAQMALGGIHEIILSRLAAGEPATLTGEVDRMVDLLLQPYEPPQWRDAPPAVEPG